jgi:hypothetical protein
MTRLTRFTAVVFASMLLLMTLPAAPYAQRGAPHPTHPARATAVRGQVFIGGYFYDPWFGPYPWWHRPIYPYYYPIYDNRAEVRVRVIPDEADNAAVYVDGYFAGVVDDFDGVFQSLPLPPGGHSIVLYLEGYRTVRHNIYLVRGSTFTLDETLVPLPAGVKSELPELARPVPPPPEGSYTTPAAQPRMSAPPEPAGTATQAVGFGTLDLFVQPAAAEVKIDGQRWVSNEEGHFMVHVPAGKHRVEVNQTGYRQFAVEIDVREGETKPLNVSLITTTS